MAIFRRRRRDIVLESQPDGVPKRGLFAEPVRIAQLRPLDPEVLDAETVRVAFLVEIRDAEDRRCPDFFVSARVTTPDRTADADGTTDMLGRMRFRATGAPGSYRIEITDVGAGGMDWDRDAGPRDASVTV